MKIIMRDRAVINATAEAIWKVLCNPQNMPRWNSKCLTLKSGQTNLMVGNQFRATFRLTGPANECTCEVMEFEPARSFRLRYFDMGRGIRGEVFESFRLKSDGNRTRVWHEVDLTHAGLPWWIKPVIWLINSIGRKSGPGPVDGLKRLVEAGN